MPAAPAPTIQPAAIGASVTANYHNRRLTTVNDHEVRLSVMTGGFDWHSHPDSDELFIGVEGELVIEFQDRACVLRPGEMLAVPRGVVHRTRPNGARSVNLTVERADAETRFIGDEGGASAGA